MSRDLYQRFSAFNLPAVCHQMKRCLCSVVLLCAMGVVLTQAARAQTSQLPHGGSRDGCGADIILFDMGDSVASGRLIVLGESEVPGVYEALVDTGESIRFALVWHLVENDPNKKGVRLQVSVGIMF